MRITKARGRGEVRGGWRGPVVVGGRGARSGARGRRAGGGEGVVAAVQGVDIDVVGVLGVDQEGVGGARTGGLEGMISSL